MNSLLEAFQAKLPAPFAVLGVRTICECVTGIEYLPRGAAPLKPQTALAREACRQFKAYLKDPAFEFDLPFDYDGTDYQVKVWKAVHAIGSGSVMSYLQVARTIGSAPRPVGTACGANRVPLLVPCHRVVASGGIGGFMNARKGPGIDIKRWLLRHENPGAW